MKSKADPRKWTETEDAQLKLAVKELGEKQWKAISLRVKGKYYD